MSVCKASGKEAAVVVVDQSEQTRGGRQGIYQNVMIVINGRQDGRMGEDGWQTTGLGTGTAGVS